MKTSIIGVNVTRRSRKKCEKFFGMSDFGTRIANAKKENKYRRGEVIGDVGDSKELQRILSVPRREFSLADYPDVTPMFRRPGGTLKFWPIQSAALIEAAQADGLFGILGVGSGKTLIGLSLPVAMDAHRAILLTKSKLKKSLQRQLVEYNKHFDLPLDRITVVAFEQLSSEHEADILEKLDAERKIDLIIIDEVHCLARMSAARTKRFYRFVRSRPTIRYAVMSGTMTRRAIQEYAPFLELAFRKNSPVPRDFQQQRDWGAALDVSPQYLMGPGALTQLCAPGESAREGYRRRLLETCGVIQHDAENIGASLTLARAKYELPDDVRAMIKTVDKAWKVGDHELDLAIELREAKLQLAQGFYYHWKWPGGVVNEPWLQARKDWRSEVMERLKWSSAGMDSPKLLERAAERWREWDEAGRPVRKPEKSWHSQFWAAWRKMREVNPPTRVAKWVSSHVTGWAQEWLAKSTTPAIIWTQYVAQATRLAGVLGVPVYTEGMDAEEAVEAKHPVIVCTISSQGTGKNLQGWYSRNLVLTTQMGGGTVEQLVGRTHRPGQEADEVVVDLVCSIPEHDAALERAVADAMYVRDSTGAKQKILYADRVGW